jgi:hypothetical protein
MKSPAIIALLSGMLTMAPMPASALLTHSFVAETGNDANACSRAAPCRTINKAISETVEGGVVGVLGPGRFDGFTITKSISVVASGPAATIIPTGSTGIAVSAGAGDTVAISGLHIEGLGTQQFGILVGGGGARLVLRDCVIRNFRFGGGGGLRVASTGTVVFVSNCVFSRNLSGVVVAPIDFTGNAIVFLDHVVIERHDSFGVFANTLGGRVRLNASSITNNGTGLSAENGAQIISFGNNSIAGNTTNGAPTVTISLK